MKAKELRIGNWINYKGNPCRFDIGDYYEANHNDEFLELLVKPIPLTEEWLLKFGFKKDTMSFWGGWLSPSFDLGSQLRIRTYSEDTYQMREVRLKHVHQLQNLYFALTGEELIIHE